mgnify:CR=1 FL=1|tara:strand:+ start:1128 stop:1376 length:249 start_codon:yes stop_codon:yes gene_type:complete
MALEKVVSDDLQINSVTKQISVRAKTSIMEDGSELSYSYHRTELTPDMDVSDKSAEIQAVAGVLWTDEVKAAYAAKLAADAQ